VASARNAPKNSFRKRDTPGTSGSRKQCGEAAACAHVRLSMI
jgi:hypothetical protein